MALVYHPPGSLDSILQNGSAPSQGDWFAQWGMAEPGLSTETIPGRDPVTGAIGPTTPQQSPYGTNQTFVPGGDEGRSSVPPSGPITMQQFSDAWMQSPYPGTVEGLKQFLASNPAYAAAGITLGGSKGDKVYGPGGQFWGDAVISAGLGGRGKSALSGDTGSQAGGQMGTLGSIGQGDFLKPFTGQFTLPTADEARNTPGYQFALDEGLKGVQRSAAARGTLLTGGTLKALNNYAQGMADTNYQSRVNNALTQFGTNYGIFKENQDRPFGKLSTLAQLGKPGA